MKCLDAIPDALPAASDEELVAMLLAGNAEAAMRGIEARYGRSLHSFAQSLCREAHLAQDVVQEVLQRVLRKHTLYQPGTNFRAWLFEIARNQALSTVRAQRRLPRPISGLASDRHDDAERLLESAAIDLGDRSLEESEFMAALAAAVAALPEIYQSVFELCVRRGLPYQEAGRQLQLPTGTVAIRVMRARKRLFAALERHLGRLRRPPACFQ